MHPLGRKLRTYGPNWITVLQYFILFGAAGFMVTFLTFTKVRNIGILYLIGIVILYLVVMLVVEALQSRLILYEKGVVIKRGKNEKMWRWEQITNMKGVRTTQKLYGVIPIISAGANHFYSGEVYAFSVGVLRSSTSKVANFVISKMVEYQLPQQLKLFDQDKTIQLGNVVVNSSGLGTVRQSITIHWQDVKAVRFNEGGFTTVSVECYSENRRIRLGVISDIGFYVLMGIVDAKLGTHMLRTEQNKQLNLPRKVSKG